MKKAIRCIVFLIVLFLIICRVYNVLKWKDTSGEYVSATKQLYATEENLIDVVFLGSSHCYCGINPDILWGEYGFSAFNMTTSGQDKLSTYHLLKETLKTQSPQVVCVEVWGMLSDKHGVEGNVHRNMLAMKLSQNAIDLVKAYVDEEKQTDYILRWPIVHTRYKEIDKYDFIPYAYSEYGRGMEMSYYIGWSTPPTEAINCDIVGELSDSNKEWLDNLYQLSEEEDFELVFFVAPAMLTAGSQEQINAAGEFAKERGIAFFDFNKLAADVGIDYSRDFLEAEHLNARGAEKITKYLGAYFDENYYLEDHRGDDAYYQWEQSYTHYEHVLKAAQLLESSTYEEYIQKLQAMDDVTYVLSFEGQYKESTLGLEQYAKLSGLTEEQYDTGGTFIFADGKMEHVLDNESDEIVIYELNKYDAFKIQNMELVDGTEGGFNDVMLNLKSMGSTYAGLNIVVYDNLQEKVIDMRGYY